MVIHSPIVYILLLDFNSGIFLFQGWPFFRIPESLIFLLSKKGGCPGGGGGTEANRYSWRTFEWTSMV